MQKNLRLNSNHSVHQKDNFGQKDSYILTYTLLKYMKKLN